MKDHTGLPQLVIAVRDGLEQKLRAWLKSAI